MKAGTIRSWHSTCQLFPYVSLCTRFISIPFSISSFFLFSVFPSLLCILCHPSSISETSDACPASFLSLFASSLFSPSFLLLMVTDIAFHRMKMAGKKKDQKEDKGYIQSLTVSGCQGSQMNGWLQKE